MFILTQRETARYMTDLLEDIDNILQTGSKFLLGKWISEAKSNAVTEGVCV